MKPITAIIAVCAQLMLYSCSKDADAPAAGGERPAAQAVQHAPENVTPGSHEDWCGEHGVPESQCTRCNPDLIAAFKATGDWCAEHGVPESQCTRCNPDLTIVRPPPADAPGER